MRAHTVFHTQQALRTASRCSRTFLDRLSEFLSWERLFRIRRLVGRKDKEKETKKSKERKREREKKKRKKNVTTQLRKHTGQESHVSMHVEGFTKQVERENCKFACVCLFTHKRKEKERETGNEDEKEIAVYCEKKKQDIE